MNKMKKVTKVEDLIKLSSCVEDVLINSTEIIKYLLVNQNKKGLEINMYELKKAYAKSLNDSYEQRIYTNDIVIKSCDLKKICCYLGMNE